MKLIRISGVRLRSWLVCCAGLLALAAPSGARAQDILQDLATNNTSFLGHTTAQSFVPHMSRLETIGFVYGDANTHLGDVLVEMTLYVGAGTGGEVVASRALDLAGHDGWVDFDFSGVTLEEGATYTFEVANIVGDRGSYDWNNIDVYAEGQRYLNGALANGDLRFRVRFAFVPCELIDAGDGIIQVLCEDGTRFTIDNRPGEDGNSCTVADNGDGTATITCTDGTSAVVSNGQDGQDGEDGEDGVSCTVHDNGDGTSTIECGDASVTIENGRDGDDGGGCTVVDNGDGTATVTCADGTSAVVGAAGSSGGGCNAHGGAPGASTYLWLLAIGAVGLVRRRRRVA